MGSSHQPANLSVSSTSRMEEIFMTNPFENYNKIRENMRADSSKLWEKHEEEFRKLSAFNSEKMFNSRNSFLVSTFENEYPTSNSSSMQVQDNKVEVCLDVSQYEPEELEVKVKDNVVTVLRRQETGSGTGNTNTRAARMFTKSFTMPHRVHPAEVESRLTQDGRLVITAPPHKLPAK